MVVVVGATATTLFEALTSDAVVELTLLMAATKLASVVPMLINRAQTRNSGFIIVNTT